MSLIRILIIGGLALAAIPMEAQQRAELTERLQLRATWILQTCERDPKFCSDAAVAWQGFVERAEDALVVSFQFVRMALFTDPKTQPAATQTDGTLTRADLAPAWSTPETTGSIPRDRR